MRLLLLLGIALACLLLLAACGRDDSPAPMEAPLLTLEPSPRPTATPTPRPTAIADIRPRPIPRPS